MDLSGSHTRTRRLRRVLIPIAAAIAVFLLLSRGCGDLLRPGAAAEDVILRHRLMRLEQLLEIPANGSVVDFERALVVIDERLVRNLLLAAIPYRGTVGGFARLVLRSADVFFDDGTALVRLDGSAWIGDDETRESFASISIYGELDVVDLDPEISVLRTRLRVIAVDAKDVRGPISPFAERLIENLGWLKIESFEGLNYDLEIPLRLGNELRLPEIEGGDVKIAATTIPLDVTLQSIRAFHHKLWVSTEIAVHNDGDSAATDTMASRDSAADAMASREPAPALAPAKKRSRSGSASGVASSAPRKFQSEAGPALVERYASLRAELAARVAADGQLTVAVADSAEIALALREKIVADLLRETARRYLDHIVLDIDTKDLHANADGELKVKTPLGKVTAGQWKVTLDFHRLRGILRARKPDVAVTAKNRVHVAVPVVLEGGSGEATLRFAWDPKGMANLVCRDFETSQRVEGKILAREYLLRGDFVLAAKADGIVADPDFPAEKFPIAVDPSADTWERVMTTLREQDRWNRCGIAMDPEKVAQRLAELGEAGFKVKLPRSIFRPVVIPASLVKSVRVGRSRVELSIRPNALRISPGTLWYSASFSTEIEGVAPAPQAPHP
jgi:hypothetical protein